MSDLVVWPKSTLRAKTDIPKAVPVPEADRLLLGPRPAEGIARENDPRNRSYRINIIRRRGMIRGVRR